MSGWIDKKNEVFSNSLSSVVYITGTKIFTYEGLNGNRTYFYSKYFIIHNGKIMHFLSRYWDKKLSKLVLMKDSLDEFMYAYLNKKNSKHFRSSIYLFSYCKKSMCTIDLLL